MPGSRRVGWAIPGMPGYREVALASLGGPGHSPGVQDAKCSFLHPKPSVHGEEPYPMRGDPVTLHNRSKGVNLEKQSPILQCECRA